jgi:hypothetical protein
MAERVQSHILGLTVQLNEDIDAMAIDDHGLLIAVFAE